MGFGKETKILPSDETSWNEHLSLNFWSWLQPALICTSNLASIWQWGYLVLGFNGIGDGRNTIEPKQSIEGSDFNWDFFGRV